MNPEDDTIESSQGPINESPSSAGWSNSKKFGLALPLLIILCMAAILLLRPSEPVYSGKPLGEWLEDLNPILVQYKNPEVPSTYSYSEINAEVLSKYEGKPMRTGRTLYFRQILLSKLSPHRNFQIPELDEKAIPYLVAKIRDPEKPSTYEKFYKIAPKWIKRRLKEPGDAARAFGSSAYFLTLFGEKSERSLPRFKKLENHDNPLIREAAIAARTQIEESVKKSQNY
jgi:hypothetical protein